jgi:inner membrane protein
VPFVSHRGPTHTLGFAVLVGLVVGGGVGALAVAGAENGAVDETGLLASAQVVAVAAFGFLVGFLAVVSHLLADALTPAGVEPWWPVSSQNYSLSLVGADSTVGNYGLLALGVFVSAVSLLAAGPLR